MDPFVLPPSGDPVSVDEPPISPERPHRGRTVLVAIATLGLVGGGVFGVSQFASADRPDLAATAQDEPDETIAPVDDTTDDDTTSDEPADESPTAPSETEGEIVLDDGDGEPIVIDLGDVDPGRLGELTECIGLPAFDVRTGAPGEVPFDLERLFDDLPFDFDALDDLEHDWPTDLGGLGGFGVDGGSVTVFGPDGMSVVDLGENGSVTVTSEDGAVTVSTEGDATVNELGDLFGEFGRIFEGGPALLDDDVFHDGALEAWPAFESIDPDEIQSCIDEVLGN